MKSAFLKLDRALFHAEGLVIFVVLFTLIVMLSLQVLFRFALNQPLDFTEEAARLLFAWLVFIGAARAMRLSQHFIVDLLYNAFPDGVRNVVGYVIDIVTILFVAALAWIGLTASIKGSGQILPVMQISSAAQTIALPIGMALMFIHALSFPLRRLHISDAPQDEIESGVAK